MGIIEHTNKHKPEKFGLVTYYKDIEFKSKLEAQWAVFFDAVGAEWEYEPQYFDLGLGVRYRPDFLISNKGRGGKKLWVEVKGVLDEKDEQKIMAFAFGSAKKLLERKTNPSIVNPILVVGKIPEEVYEYRPNDGLFFNFRLIDGDFYGAHLLAAPCGGAGLYGDDYIHECDGFKSELALSIARNARFDHKREDD